MKLVDHDTISEEDSKEWCPFPKCSEWVQNDGKKALGNVALLTAMILYTCIGAKIFQALEYDVEKEHLLAVTKHLVDSRQRFVQEVLHLTESPTTITGNNNNSSFSEGDNVSNEITAILRSYEKTVEKSLDEGASLDDGPIIGRWHYTQSFFFSATVLTTVGYGNIAPSTLSGRIFCMIFALVGIPLTLSGIAVIGDMLASVLPFATLQRLLPVKLREFFENSGSGKSKAVLVVLGSVSLLLAFIALGGVLFMWREDWTFMEASYFCFISTTTIGFGDLVPEDIFVCTVYVLVGLSLTSTVIELVRRQYASSWDHMKQLSSRLHTLSGPLALAMKRMAETGAGVVTVDMELVRELRDINVALSKVHDEEPNEEEQLEDDPWTALLNMASKKRITVVMYESNV